MLTSVPQAFSCHGQAYGVGLQSTAITPFLKKEKLYPEVISGCPMRSTKRTLRQLLEATVFFQVTVAWQVEPTLMGLDFFRRLVELQRNIRIRHRDPLSRMSILLDSTELCGFFHENNFLIGLSLQIT